jgi:hypothetical protein
MVLYTIRGVILVSIVTLTASICVLPCSAQQRCQAKERDVWVEDGHQGPKKGHPRFELTNEEFDQIIKSLKESDPAKAKELAHLRKEDQEKFNAKLRDYAPEELGKIVSKRAKTWWDKKRAEFTEWLKENYSRQAEELAKLEYTEPDLYWKKFDLVRDKYWRIFEEERRNPELAEVLKEDLALREREEELVSRIKTTKKEAEKTELTTELEEVISRRFDLIIRRKQIAYERLLKWLEELKNRIKHSNEEILKWQNEEFKAENVARRLKELIEGNTPKFRWD